VKAAAVLYVKDLRRMQSFYATCFDMDLTADAEDYCVLESGSLTLSLVVVPAPIAATIDVSVPPVRRDAIPIKLGFAVSSIEGLRPLVAQLGGWIDPTTTRWEFRGSVHCDGVDPEGNVLQLLEPIAPATS
jgi:predicted enzyme related to lactoylglutathione lyase